MGTVAKTSTASTGGLVGRDPATGRFSMISLMDERGAVKVDDVAEAFARGGFELPQLDHDLKQFIARVNLMAPDRCCKERMRPSAPVAGAPHAMSARATSAVEFALGGDPA